jgi:hypothetical protein
VLLLRHPLVLLALLMVPLLLLGVRVTLLLPQALLLLLVE